MERYQVILAYDGTDFLGFQRQAKPARTVQQCVEEALRHLQWRGNSILCAGRTDVGVHASGQVIAFDLEWRHSEAELAQALNAYLPMDVAARAVCRVPADFHPRYQAHSRCYCYRLLSDRYGDPLRERYAWRIDETLDKQLLEASAALLPGYYDCAAFGSPPRKGDSTYRRIFQATWQTSSQGLLEFTITANAFLYHMARRIVYLLVQAGRERLALDEFASGIRLEAPLPGGLAPARGLILTSVAYAPDEQEGLSRQPE